MKPNKENLISDILVLLCTHTTYLESYAQINAKVPMCRRTFDKYWKEANLRHREGQQAIQQELEQDIKFKAKQSLKTALWTREEILFKLMDIVRNGRDSDKIKACKLICDIQGYKAPIKSEIETKHTPIFGNNPLLKNLGLS